MFNIKETPTRHLLLVILINNRIGFTNHGILILMVTLGQLLLEP